ncbi:MAG: hypothetical protein ACXVRH_06410 [Thermoleophilaceae bacterium]
MTLAGLTACGGGKKQQATTAAKPPVSQGTTTTQAAAPGPAVKPKRHRSKPSSSSAAPLRVSAPYTCNGKPLRAIAADGPVKVQPAIVKPGQSFTVTVTEPGARVADVTLAGVAAQPILVKGALRSGALEAKIRMPAYASCGNKLLEIEGDISAEAYVGVGKPN